MKPLVRWAQFGLLVAIAAMLAFDIASRGMTAPAGWRRLDVITVMLACLGVMLTTMTIFLAVGAILGYNAIKAEALAGAQNAVADAIEEHRRTLTRERAGGIGGADNAAAADAPPDDPYGAAAGGQDAGH